MMKNKETSGILTSVLQ